METFILLVQYDSTTVTVKKRYMKSDAVNDSKLYN